MRCHTASFLETTGRTATDAGAPFCHMPQSRPQRHTAPDFQKSIFLRKF
jgi:hypothetical protein